MSQDKTQGGFGYEDLDLMNDVPASGGGFKNFGKLSIGTRFIRWENGTPTEVDAANWKATPQKGTDGKNQKGMELVFGVDVQEFNSGLQFTYERKVAVNGADWFKTLVPSIEAIMGKGSMASEGGKHSATLKSLAGKYVCVEDVPQQPRKNAAPNAKVYNTISFVKVYESREACYAEWKATTGNTGNGNGTEGVARDPMLPADPAWTNETWYGVKGDLEKAINEAQGSAKTPPAKVKAKGEAIKKFAADYGATVEQVEHLLNAA